MIIFTQNVPCTEKVGIIKKKKKRIDTLLPFRPDLIRRSSSGDLNMRSEKASANTFEVATATP